MYLKWLILLCLASSWCWTNGLKCRSQEGINESDMKRIVRTCMQRNGNGNQDDNRDNDDNRGRFGNSRRNFDYNQGQQESNGYNQRWQRSLSKSSRDWENRDNASSAGHGAGEGQGQCVAQCFFEELNMVDGNGQPDRRKVSYLLTKDLKDRELRNFYMDTVQQCFSYLENTRNRNNKCSQSRQLVKCLTEYAKAQCDDWDDHSTILFT
ncbi:Odorant-binding protein 59a [Drosophila willistoni]|uniref:GK19390 n=1 Tax=Drosophila willistoni TaxID=7260 RepID=B4MQC0_DROWI|nr:Odorant-binding protein 59a [Drosophila willistoni]